MAANTHPTRLQQRSRSGWLYGVLDLSLFGSALILGGSLGVYLTQQMPTLHRSQAVLLVDSPPTLPAAPESALSDQPRAVLSHLALLRSSPLFYRALAQIHLSPEQAPFERLSVTAAPGTSLIQVGYEAESSGQAVQVVDSLVDLYRQEASAENQERVLVPLRALQQRLAEQQQIVQKAQDQLESFQQQHRFLGTSEELATINATLQDLTSQVDRATAELAALDQKIATFAAELPDDLQASLAAAGRDQDPGYQQLQAESLRVEADLAALQARYTDQNPQVQAALERRDRVQELLLQRSISLLGEAASRAKPLDPLRQRLAEQLFVFEAERAAQAARLAQITRQWQETDVRHQQLPSLLNQHARLQSEVETALRLAQDLAQRYGSAQLLTEQNFDTVRVVEPARLVAISAWPGQLRSLAWILGAGLGVSLIWIRHRIGPNHNAEIRAAQQLWELPTLATIPAEARLTSLAEALESPLFDSYQLLDSHLHLLVDDLRVVAVCSWTGSEGSLVVAENLALLEAGQGRRVVLVRADAQPLLGTTTMSLAEAYDVVVSPLHPSLMAAREWHCFLKQARQQYDLVLVDCPPARQGSAATLVAAVSDGVVWVTDADHLEEKAAVAVADTLRTWHSRLLGKVIMSH